MMHPTSCPMRVATLLSACLLAGWFSLVLLGGGGPGWLPSAIAASKDELEINVATRDLGKEVTLRQGTREWFMLIEVTPDNTIILRQEKDNDTYVVDESETHDRAFSDTEVDVAIQDYINSVMQQVKKP